MFSLITRIVRQFLTSIKESWINQVMSLMQKNGKIAMQECDPDHIALISAIENGEFDQVNEILARDSENKYMRPVGALQVTALQMAAWQGNIDLLNRLYKRGADVNDMDKIGRCALYYAAHNGNTDMAKWLLQHGGHIDVKVGIYSCTKDVPYSSLTKSYLVGRKVRIAKIIREFLLNPSKRIRNYISFFRCFVLVAVTHMLGKNTVAPGGKK